MKRVLKWLVVGVGVLVLVLVVAVGGVYALSARKLSKSFDVEVRVPPIPTDPESLAEGKRLTVAFGCTECHGPDLSGQVLIDAAPMGHIVAPNLTPGQGGVGATNAPEDWFRALRHGIGHDGRLLVIMPSSEYARLGDGDLGRIVAYLQTLPPVDHDLGPRTLGPVARMIITSGGLVEANRIDHHASPVEAPARGATREYGAYLATLCAGCHGEELNGGVEIQPGAPRSANLTPNPDEGLGNWAFEDFKRALTEGRRPDGTQLSDVMPWRSTRSMEDDELQAVWLFLRSLPPRPTGGEG